MDEATLEMTKDRWLKDQPHAGDVTNHIAAHRGKLTVKEPPAGSLEALSNSVQQAATSNMFIRPRPQVPEGLCCMLKGWRAGNRDGLCLEDRDSNSPYFDFILHIVIIFLLVSISKHEI